MAMTNEEAHELARKRGTSRLIYGTARVVLTPIAATWYRLKVTGSEYVPKDGPAIIAPNHKSFYDSFFIGLATKRHLHFMAKTELFEGRSAKLLSGLGAFPVRRGTADPDELKAPRRGVGRLAIEAGCPIVPCAITGTEKLFIGGWFPKPVKIQVS